MEIVNLKLLDSLLKISPAFLSPRYSTWAISTVVSKISSSLYHNGSWEYTEKEDHKSSSNNSFIRNSVKHEFECEGPEDSTCNSYQGIQKEEKSHNSERDLKTRERRPNWEKVKLKPIKKNVYTYSPQIENRSAEEIENYRKVNNLTLHGKNIPNPLLRLSDYEFPKEVVETFKNLGVETPTPIQAEGWSLILRGHNIIGIGQTGSGKTLGYIVPGLVHIFNQPPLKEEEGPIGLVLAPTRELAQQIYDVSFDMFNRAGLRTTCAYGGSGVNSKNKQLISLRKWPHLCIFTPGRLIDFLEIGVINLRRCSYLVIDEADRMLNMGFETQIRRILKQIRPDRQILMWSATWPKDVQKLAHEFLDDFIQLNVGSTELFANPDIKQVIEVCNPFEKQNRLLRKLKELTEEHTKILIFAETKVQVDFIVKFLGQKGLFVIGIHSDIHQDSRNKILKGFKEGRYSILVATDIASRGIDVRDITLVVNYDFPLCIEHYVHRIGRTGRAGKSGTALSFITSGDNMSAIKALIKLLERSNHEVLPSLYELAKREKELKEIKKKFRGFHIDRYSRFRNKFK